MSFNINRFYEAKIFEIGQIADAIKHSLSNISIDPMEISYSIYSDFSKNGEERHSVSYNELLKICSFDPQNRSIYFSFKDDTPHPNIIGFGIYKGFLQLSISVNKMEIGKVFIEVFEQDLSLIIVDEKLLEDRNLGKEFDELSNRLSIIEETLLRKPDKLRCFISYRFNEEAQNIIIDLKSFLELIGVEVITGYEYEPRKISDKVSDKLDDSIDLVVYLITKEGESFWTRDEIASGYGKKCYTIPILEKGMAFENGIFGNLEYIEFESGHIGDSFIRLLQGIRFIRNNKQ